jgi:hypothetical protein
MVNSVDPRQHKVSVSHAPIPEIGWPAMTMEFPVAPSVDYAVRRRAMTVTRRRLTQRAGGTGAFTLISRPTRSLLAAPDRAPLLTGTEFELDIEPVLLTIVAGPWRPASTAKSLLARGRHRHA